jgi:hypothetical protein
MSTVSGLSSEKFGIFAKYGGKFPKLVTLAAKTVLGDQPMKILHLPIMWPKWETIVVPQSKIHIFGIYTA